MSLLDERAAGGVEGRGVAVLRDGRGVPYPVEDLRRLWPLGGWRRAEPLVGGKNEHIRLLTGEGVRYLRRSHRAKPAPELERQLALMRLLREAGLSVPVVVPTATGAAWAEVAGRLYTVTEGLDGSPYDDGRDEHVRELGRVLARYHDVVRDLPADGPEPALLQELEQRADADADADGELGSRGRRVARDLRRLLPHLPRCVVHGGARRGSLLFRDDRVVGVLDFDSARPDVRVLDLAVAAHDVGKVYTVVGAADHKVALDVDRVRRLVAGYADAGGVVTEAEAEALPLLVEAKRLKRCLGRVQRQHRGEPLSPNDLAKIELERSRLRWLAGHRAELAEAVRPAPRAAPGRATGRTAGSTPEEG